MENDKMTDAELRKLSGQVLRNMLIMHGVKWALIIGVTRGLKRALEES